MKEIIFNKLYPLIVQNTYRRTGVWPAQFNTPAHKEFIFERLENGKLLTTSGKTTKMMRFYEVFARLEDPGDGLQDYYFDVIFYLVVVGLQRRWWPSWDAFMAKVAATVAEIPEVGPADAGQPSANSLSMKASFEEGVII